MSQFDVLASHRAFVRTVFADRNNRVWTTMGFGMIRTYLDPANRWRLNVWDDRLVVLDASDIHDHPWDFRSYCIAGELTNVRYSMSQNKMFVPTHQYHYIETGEGIDDRRRSDVHHCSLVPMHPEIMWSGMSYRQAKEEVHRTTYKRGTVTLNDRTPATKEHTARVFWPVGEEWVNAMPRVATHEERDAAIEAALGRMYEEEPK